MAVAVGEGVGDVVAVAVGRGGTFAELEHAASSISSSSMRPRAHRRARLAMFKMSPRPGRHTITVRRMRLSSGALLSLVPASLHP